MLYKGQVAHILTWFVTSSVVGLYVVMPCVPTEKTRLYLEQTSALLSANWHELVALFYFLI